MRVNVKRAWEAKHDNNEARRRQTFIMYLCYYDASFKIFFRVKDLLDQNMNAEINHCRRINEEYNRSTSGSSRARHIYAHTTKSGMVYKTRYWWVLFLNMEEGPHLDKFVSDSLTDGGFFPCLASVNETKITRDSSGSTWKPSTMSKKLRNISADQMEGDSACKSFAISQKCTSYTNYWFFRERKFLISPKSPCRKSA